MGDRAGPEMRADEAFDAIFSQSEHLDQAGAMNRPNLLVVLRGCAC